MRKILFPLFIFLSVVLSGLGTGRLHAQEKTEDEALFTVWANKEHTVDTDLTLKGLRPRVGLVLSGGGAKGIAHVGVLKVLEELGIPIDYIGGTSMGSIIGGLYAYGYSAHELDSIVRSVNWGQILNDKPDWAYVFYEDKKNYMLSLPFSFHGETSFTPIGFIKGQHINNLFYTLTSRSYQYKSFKELNIPYFCTVADLVSGKAVYIDSGNLAMSMRSSMAVPGVFAPVSLDTMVLVDGGVLNNFPVDIMLERGADIVIGVDVGYAYAEVEPSSNFLDILQQVIFMGSKHRIVGNRNNCDILIRPDMTGFTSSSFSKADSLLTRGESAARSKETYNALQQLSRELAAYQQDAPKEKKPYLPPDQLFVSEIRYEGLSKYNKGFINQFLQVEPGRWTKLTDIVDGVNRLYGTMVFRIVTYELLQDSRNEEAVILVIKVEEAPANTFSVGVKFDNDRSATLLAGLELRNLGFKNSLLIADLELSKMLNFKLDYIVRPDWKLPKKKFSLWVPSAGFNFEFNRFTTQLYRDPDNMRRSTNTIISNRYRVRIYGQSSWKLNVFGLGFAYEYATNAYSPQPDSASIYRHDVYANAYVYPYLYFKHNSYNKKFYPTKGSAMNIEINFPVLVSKNTSEARLNDAAHYYLSAYWTADFAFGIGKKKRVALYPGFTLGAILFRNSREIPIQHQFFQGSCSDLSGWYNSPLPGTLLGQSSGYFIINARLTAQIMIIKNLYLSLRGGVGRTEYDIKDWLDLERMKRIIYGGNIGLSYNTPVGPVGISFQTSNVHRFNIFLNIGYWF